jgi:hypothetical protein
MVLLQVLPLFLIPLAQPLVLPSLVDPAPPAQPWGPLAPSSLPLVLALTLEEALLLLAPFLIVPLSRRLILVSISDKVVSISCLYNK